MGSLYRNTSLDFTQSNEPPLNGVIRNRKSTSNTKEEPLYFGDCVTDNGDSYKCLVKTYRLDDNEFYNALEMSCLIRNTGLKDYGPDVYHIDYTIRVIKMAFIKGETLYDFLQKDYTNNDDKTRDMIIVFSQIEKLLNTFSQYRIAHSDLKATNIIISRVNEDTGGIRGVKFVDFDTMKQYPTDGTILENRIYMEKKKKDEDTLIFSCISIISAKETMPKETIARRLKKLFDAGQNMTLELSVNRYIHDIENVNNMTVEELREKLKFAKEFAM